MVAIAEDMSETTTIDDQPGTGGRTVEIHLLQGHGPESVTKTAFVMFILTGTTIDRETAILTPGIDIGTIWIEMIPECPAARSMESDRVA